MIILMDLISGTRVKLKEDALLTLRNLLFINANKNTFLSNSKLYFFLLNIKFGHISVVIWIDCKSIKVYAKTVTISCRLLEVTMRLAFYFPFFFCQ